jgi:hypothetical protein
MANRKDLEEPEDLAEFRMRSFRISSPASRSYASDGLGKSVSLQGSQISDVSVLRQEPLPLFPETRLARLLVVDKINGRLRFGTHLLWFLKLFCWQVRLLAMGKSTGSMPRDGDGRDTPGHDDER